MTCAKPIDRKFPFADGHVTRWRSDNCWQPMINLIADQPDQYLTAHVIVCDSIKGEQSMSIRNDERFRGLFQGETPILEDGGRIIVRHWHWGDRDLVNRVVEIYRIIKPQWEHERDRLLQELTEQVNKVAPEFRTDVKNPKLRLMFELVFIFDKAGHAVFEIVGEECPSEPKDLFMQDIASRNPRIKAVLNQT